MSKFGMIGVYLYIVRTGTNFCITCKTMAFS